MPGKRNWDTPGKRRWGSAALPGSGNTYPTPIGVSFAPPCAVAVYRLTPKYAVIRSAGFLTLADAFKWIHKRKRRMANDGRCFIVKEGYPADMLTILYGNRASAGRFSTGRRAESISYRASQHMLALARARTEGKGKGSKDKGAE